MLERGRKKVALMLLLLLVMLLLPLMMLRAGARRPRHGERGRDAGVSNRL